MAVVLYMFANRKGNQQRKGKGRRRRLPCGTRQQAVVTPVSVLKMAKKRTERQEACGISTSEEETKANVRNVQVVKGGL